MLAFASLQWTQTSRGKGIATYEPYWIKGVPSSTSLPGRDLWSSTSQAAAAQAAALWAMLGRPTRAWSTSAFYKASFKGGSEIGKVHRAGLRLEVRQV